MDTTNKSWRTTVTSFAGAIVVASYPLIQNGDFDLKRDWVKIVGAAIIAIFGYNAKDANVTGLPSQPKQEQNGTVTGQ